MESHFESVRRRRKAAIVLFTKAFLSMTGCTGYVMDRKMDNLKHSRIGLTHSEKIAGVKWRKLTWPYPGAWPPC